MARRLAWLAALGLAAGCARPLRPFHPPELDPRPRRLSYEERARVFRLKSGLRLVLLPEPETNLVKVDVRYDLGAAEDPPGKTGLAHLVEHLMFEVRPGGPGTPTLGNELGGIALAYNAYTTADETEFSAIALSEHLPALLALEAKRLQASCADLDPEAFAREREVVRNELRQRDGLELRAAQLVQGAVYGRGHPYARPVGGSDRDIAGLAMEDVCRFMATQYAPERAIVLVTGNVPEATLKALGASLLGAVPARPSEPRALLPPVTLRGTTSQHELAIQEATAFIVFTAPTLRDPAAPAVTLLTGAFAQRLAALEERAPEITAIDVTPAGGARAPLTAVVVSVNDPGRLPGAVNQIFAEWKRYLEELNAPPDQRPRPLGWVEPRVLFLEMLRENHRHALLSALEAFRQRGDLFADHLQAGDDAGFVLRELRALEGLSAPDLRDAAAGLFRREHSHIVYIRPNARARPIRERAELTYSPKEHELPESSVPIAEDEASRPLALPRTGSRAGVRELVLDNGLRVLLVPRLAYPLVDIRVVFPRGSLADPPDQAGLADLSARLLSPDLNRDYEWQDLRGIMAVLKMGGRLATRTGLRSTTFRLVGLAAHADALLWRVHWLLESGVYLERDLDHARETIRAAMGPSQRREDERGRQVRARLYGARHPYTRPAFSAETVARIGVDDLERFREHHYRARGATLIVAGQFDAVAVERQIRRLFGRWEGGPPPPAPEEPPARPRRSPAALLFADDQAALISIRVAFPTRSGFDRRHAERLVLREILELRMRRVRTGLGSTYGIAVDQAFRHGPGLLEVMGQVDPTRAGESLAAILHELSALRAGEGIAADFVRARRRVLRQLLAEETDSGSVADLLESFGAHGLPLDTLDRIAHDVATLTIARVREVLAADLAPERAVMVLAGPALAAEVAYHQAGLVPTRF